MKSFCIFVALVTMTFAFEAMALPKEIPGKPTYGETIAYIRSYFESQSSFSVILRGSRQSDSVASQKVLEVKFDGCMVSTKYEEIGVFGERTVVANKHDLTTVDAVTVWTKYGQRGSDTMYGIGFSSKGQNTWALPLSVIELGERQNKIVKAFNHLRKLCDAPEPAPPKPEPNFD